MTEPEIVEVDEPEECPLCICEEHKSVTDAVIAAFLAGAAATLEQTAPRVTGQAFSLCVKHTSRMAARFTCSSAAVFDVINRRRNT